MWPFGKKFPPLKSIPIDGEWSLSRGENAENPMIVRLKTSAGDYAGHPDLSVRLGIAIPLRAPDANGFPSEEEGEQLGKIEDSLIESLGRSGRLVLVITTSGMREFISYVRSDALGQNAATAVQAATSTHEVQHYTESDPKWTVYSQFNDALVPVFPR